MSGRLVELQQTPDKYIGAIVIEDIESNESMEEQWKARSMVENGLVQSLRPFRPPTRSP